MLDDVMKITGALWELVISEEMAGGSGEDKKKRAVDKILAAVKSEGGIEIKSKWILYFLPGLVSALVELIVYQANKYGLFVK